MTILVVEDEKRLSRHMDKALSDAGHQVWVECTLKAAASRMEEALVDLLLLDLNLPDGDGLEFMKQQRTQGYLGPVLILSARDAVEDRVRGLDLGADDYLAKPFSIDEMLARVRSFSRRLAALRPQVLCCRDVSLDLLAHKATCRGKPLFLTAREYALLEFFLSNPGRILSRRVIAEKVWGVTYDLQTNLIEVYVRKLRQKLEEPGDAPFIRTLRGVGYMMDTAASKESPSNPELIDGGGA